MAIPPGSSERAGLDRTTLATLMVTCVPGVCPAGAACAASMILGHRPGFFQRTNLLARVVTGRRLALRARRLGHDELLDGPEADRLQQHGVEATREEALLLL